MTTNTGGMKSRYEETPLDCVKWRRDEIESRLVYVKEMLRDALEEECRCRADVNVTERKLAEFDAWLGANAGA